jgi:hypothetical protein
MWLPWPWRSRDSVRIGSAVLRPLAAPRAPVEPRQEGQRVVVDHDAVLVEVGAGGEAALSLVSCTAATRLRSLTTSSTGIYSHFGPVISRSSRGLVDGKAAGYTMILSNIDKNLRVAYNTELAERAVVKVGRHSSPYRANSSLGMDAARSIRNTLPSPAARSPTAFSLAPTSTGP